MMFMFDGFNDVKCQLDILINKLDIIVIFLKSNILSINFTFM